MPKRVVLDTSALVRFFAGDDLEKAKKIEEVLRQEKVMIPEVVLSELEFVMLGKIYGRTRGEFKEVLEFLVNRPNVWLSKEMKQAIEIYSSSRQLSVADCLVIAHGIKWGEVMSFDKRLVRKWGDGY